MDLAAVLTPAQERIGDATIYVIATQGFDVVSVRTVAEQTGVTGGTIQYHFPTRESLLASALQRSFDRQRELLRSTDRDLPPDEYLFACLVKLLPTNPRYSEDAIAWVAFVAASKTRPWLAELVQSALDTFHAFLASHLEHALAEGSVVLASSPQQSARLLSALLDGLTLDSVNISPERYRQVESDLMTGIHLIVQVDSARTT